jgi:flagellar protein FliS
MIKDDISFYDRIRNENMYGNTAHNVYAQNNIAIESKEKLIEMLYEGVLRFNMQAKKAINDGDIEKRVYFVNRSIAIISELTSSLDSSQGQVSEYLDGLYNYQLQQLTFASIENDISKIDSVNTVFKGLLAAWRESTQVS